jgi:hypothetical protein
MRAGHDLRTRVLEQAGIRSEYETELRLHGAPL